MPTYLHAYIPTYLHTYYIPTYLHPPPLTLEYWGGRTRNFSETFHLTTGNIPPTCFLGFQKKWGGSSGCHILAQRWHGTPFHFRRTYIFMHSTRPWRDHYKPDFFSWNISRCGGGTPPLFEIFQFLPLPTPPPLRGDIPTYLLHIYLHTCYIPTCLHAYTPTDLRNYAPTYLHAYIPTHLPIYLHTDINVYIHTYIHT